MKMRRGGIIHPWSFWPISEPSDTTTQQAPQPRQLTPAERKARKRWLWRMRHPHYGRERYWRDVEASRAYHASWRERNRDKLREYINRWQRNRRAHLKATDPLGYAVYLRDERDRAARRREARIAYMREYYAKNREKFLEYERAKRVENPGYISKQDIVQRARAREAWIVMLRGQELSWKQIADRVGTTIHSCRGTYYHAVKRRGQQEANQMKRLAKQREHDAFLLSSYREGMTWAEYARVVGYRLPDSAMAAYMRALDRAIRPDSEQSA